MNAPARHVFPYEKLDVWQDARVLIGEVYRTTERFPSTEKFSIVSQINRAAVSVACNLAEGSARTSYKDQAHFSQIAYSSLMELSCLLTISQDLGFISQETASSLADKIAPLSSRINKLRQVQLKRAAD